jgi:hypothetical protein
MMLLYDDFCFGTPRGLLYDIVHYD